MSDPATTPREHKADPIDQRFKPKNPVVLDAPKDELMSYEELSKCDGTDPEQPILVAIKGTIFDVTRNNAYKPGGSYHVFAGKDPSRALGMSSLKPEDCVPEWHDLEGKYKTVLDEWYTFFSKRYNVVGQVAGANNLDQ